MKSNLSCSMMEKILKLSGLKRSLSDPKRVQKMLIRLNKSGEKPYKFNLKRYPVKIEKETFEGMDYYVLNKDPQTPSPILVFYHGGAYVRQPNYMHWRMLSNIAKDTGIAIYVPIYPKIPYHDAVYAYEKLIGLHRYLTETLSRKRVLFMGGSSGGGLALGLAEVIRDQGLVNPLEIILISPWLDVTMSDPSIKDIEPRDVVLGSYGLKKCGELWAGDKPLTDPMVSPLFGDLSKLPDITVFTSTHDILNVDAHRLVDRCHADHTQIRLIEKPRCPHVYPILPIQESKEALALIETIIQKYSYQ